MLWKTDDAIDADAEWMPALVRYLPTREFPILCWLPRKQAPRRRSMVQAGAIRASGPRPVSHASTPLRQRLAESLAALADSVASHGREDIWPCSLAKFQLNCN
jgi:hypothetical protein